MSSILTSVAQQILRLRRYLDFVAFVHILREWNGVVHCLVKWAFEQGTDWNIGDWEHLPLECSQRLERLVGEDLLG